MHPDPRRSGHHQADGRHRAVTVQWQVTTWKRQGTDGLTGVTSDKALVLAVRHVQTASPKLG